MLLALRREAGLQRHGWLLPLLGFMGGLASFLLVQRADELAKIFAVMVLAGWAWLCIQPAIRHKFETINCTGLNRDAINPVAQAIHQSILFFSLPFLLLSTKTHDPGQVLVTGFVVLMALLVAVDSFYARHIARRQLPFIAVHCLCSFITSLIVLPIVVDVPAEQTFNIALLLAVLWLVTGAPLSRRHNEISLRVFLMALLFPLLVWSFKNHIPPTGILVERSVLTNEIANREPVRVLSEANLDQLKDGLYLHASIKAPLGLNPEVIVSWRHGTYAEEMASISTGGHETGYRTYALNALKKDFLPDALGHWTVDILTSDRQLLDRLEFEVLPTPFYSAFSAPNTEFSIPRVTGLVIKPSM